MTERSDRSGGGGPIGSIRPLPGAIAGRLPAAAEVIAERGLEDTKMEDIAAAAGVAKNTLYYYFGGKDDILVYLLTDVLHGLSDSVSVAMQTEGSAAARLAEVVSRQVAVMHDQPAVCRCLMANLGRAGRLPDILDGVRRAYLEPVERLIIEGAHDGSLRPVADPPLAALSVFGMVTITAIGMMVQHRPLHRRDAAQLVETVLHGFVSTDDRRRP